MASTTIGAIFEKRKAVATDQAAKSATEAAALAAASAATTDRVVADAAVVAQEAVAVTALSGLNPAQLLDPDGYLYQIVNGVIVKTRPVGPDTVVELPD